MKDRLQITTTDRDAAIIRVVNTATDLIERACGKSGLERFPNDGHFVQKKYVNEVYSIHGMKQIHLRLRNAPVAYLIVTGDLTAGSAVVQNVTPSVGIIAGMPLYAAQGLFPQNTSVLSVSGSTVTMSAPASVTQTGTTFEISGLIKFEWRAGTPDSPSWTGFFPPQYELDQQGYAGVVRVYGPMPSIYNNMIRATYVAGFPIDWPNAGNGSTHQLPADLTNTCENIAVRILKRMPLDGKASENIQGATTAWRNDLDQMDLDTINRYTRVAMVF